MVTRAAIVVLWLVAGGWAFNYLGLLFGGSSIQWMLLAGGASVLILAVRSIPTWRLSKVEPDQTGVITAQRSVRSSY